MKSGGNMPKIIKEAQTIKDTTPTEAAAKARKRRPGQVGIEETLLQGRQDLMGLYNKNLLGL